MYESVEPRGGTDGQGKPLAGVDEVWNANDSNGHEYVNPERDDLQYACVFSLPRDPQTGQTTRDCATTKESCDCRKGSDNTPGPDEEKSPLCQNPTDNSYSTIQYRAKAYPGSRELEVLKKFGDNSIVASICAQNLNDPNAQNYGYRPAIDAIVDRLKEQLSDKCLPRVLKTGADGEIPCSVIEVQQGGSVPCDPARGRKEPKSEVIKPIQERLKASRQCGVDGQPECEAFKLCELQEVKTAACHQATDNQPDPGWCYVDPEHQPNDDPALVDGCPSGQKRVMRFVDNLKQTPATNSIVMIACFGADPGDPDVTMLSAPN